MFWVRNLYNKQVSKNTEYRDYIVEDVLQGIPGITTKRVFSGWGVYKYRRIFGLIIDGEFYFKTNEKNIAEFKKRDSHTFVYNRKGKIVALGYWTLPDEIYGDDEMLLEWIERSVS